MTLIKRLPGCYEKPVRYNITALVCIQHDPLGCAAGMRGFTNLYFSVLYGKLQGLPQYKFE